GPGADREEQRLVVACVGVEELVAGFRRRAGPDRGDEPLRGADVPVPATTTMTVRGRADRDVVGLVPVDEVVPALVTGPGPVRDLVPVEPGAPEHVVGDLVLLRLVVVVGRAARTHGDVLPERRPRLDGQRVGTDVLGPEGERGIEGAAPVVDR